MPRTQASTPEKLDLFLDEMAIGHLYYRAADHRYALEIIPAFLASSHEIAPIVYPQLDAFQSGLVQFHGKPKPTIPFPGGLPGFIVDSLPDKWGQLLLDSEHPGLGKSLMGSFARVGAGGPGAIVFRLPGQAPSVPGEPKVEDLAELARLAEKISRGQPVPPEQTGTLGSGGTLGGIYPKVGAHLL